MIELKYENFKGYFIDRNGNIYSNKRGKLKKLSPFLDTRKKYMMIRLQSNKGVRKGFLIHRLVAEHFLKNPNNYRDVHHKDNNPQNNNVDNLEWITHRKNLEHSYQTMTPTRNYINCKIYYNNKFYCECKTIKEAAELANKKWNASIASLRKYYKYKNIEIKL